MLILPLSIVAPPERHEFGIGDRFVLPAVVKGGVAAVLQEYLDAVPVYLSSGSRIEDIYGAEEVGVTGVEDVASPLVLPRFRSELEISRRSEERRVGKEG